MLSEFEKRVMAFLLAVLVGMSGGQFFGLEAFAQEGEEALEAPRITESFQAEENLTKLGEMTEGEWYTFSGDTSEYYTFEPQKTGYYILDGRYYAIGLEDDGSSYCGGPVYRLEQGNTYTLRLNEWYAYEETSTRIVSYDNLDTITTGMRVSGQENTRVYRFIPDSDGIYVFDWIDGRESEVFCDMDEILDPVDAWFTECGDILEIAEGQGCLVVVSGEEEGLEVKKCTDKGEAKAGAEYGGQGSGCAIYTFAPSTPGYYFVTGAIMDLTGDVGEDNIEQLFVRDDNAWLIRTTESGQVRIIVDESVKLRIESPDSVQKVMLNKEMKSYGVEMYQYTAEESGVYYLEMPYRYDAEFLKTVGDRLEQSSNTVSLEKGEKVLILADGWHDSDSCLQWTLKGKVKKGTLDLELGKVYSLSSDEYYEYIPAEDMECINYGAFEIYDQEWERLYRYSMSLSRGTTYYVTSLRNGQGKLCASDAAMTRMELGKEYTVFEDEGLYFMPTQTGFYTLDWDDNVWGGYISYGEESTYLCGEPAYLVSGREYGVSLSELKDDYMPAKIALRKVVPETLAVGERKVIAENTTGVGYILTIPGTGDYAISVEGSGHCLLYDKNDILTTWNSEAEALQWTMEANKEYYVCVSSERGVSGSIQVDKIFLSGDYEGAAEPDGTVRIVAYSGTAKDVSIPDKLDGKAVSRIGIESFRDKDKLQTLSVPSGVTEIQYQAFKNCRNLREVEFRSDSALKTIGVSAFEGCSNLKAVHIPATVTKIGAHAFGYRSRSSVSPMEDFVIYGVEGTEAQRYAQENGIIFVVEGQEGAFIKGDLNGDRKVNLLDLRTVLRAICGKTTLTGEQKNAADINGDGAVNLLDLRLILRYICGKITSL